MIPVRGPTFFEKQFNEFVHGNSSKSGISKNAVIRGGNHASMLDVGKLEAQPVADSSQ